MNTIILVTQKRAEKTKSHTTFNIQTQKGVNLTRYSLDGFQENNRQRLQTRVLTGIHHAIGTNGELEEFLSLAYDLEITILNNIDMFDLLAYLRFS